jgi:hypothetical protein
MKPKQTGFYRMLWTESARKIGFTWHRSEMRSQCVPKWARWNGVTVASDYYHHAVEGQAGLEKWAEECDMTIDWQNDCLIPNSKET